MPTLSLIVAHAKNRIIGKDNDMPWHLPADLAYFKEKTMGKPVVMGRKTFDSIGRPLPKRQNIIITRDKNFVANGVDVVHSIEQALELVKNNDEVMVIGGGSIYQHCIAFADRLYITFIDAEIEGDTQFPEYNIEKQWQLTSELLKEADESNAYNLRFCIYDKK